MAFLGDFGKTFLGGAKTGQVVTAGASFLGLPAPVAGAIGGAAQVGADVVDRATSRAPSPALGEGAAVELGPRDIGAPREASMGLLPSVMAGGRAALPYAQRGLNWLRGNPGTTIGLGLTGATGASMIMGPDGKPRRITRKMQSQVKQLAMMVGLEQAADILGLSVQEAAFILVKRFPRRGGGISAAQLRTTRRTMNKIVHIHDQMERNFKRSTTRRRSPSTTKITQVK